MLPKSKLRFLNDFQNWNPIHVIQISFEDIAMLWDLDLNQEVSSFKNYQIINEVDVY